MFGSFKATFKHYLDLHFGCIRTSKAATWADLITCGWLAGWLTGWLACWLAGWLAGFVVPACVGGAPRLCRQEMFEWLPGFKAERLGHVPVLYQ